ncbi:Alpha/Beta hydrolase protein [Aspergillus carlsbadensis]|nr:Alpha/Beta hydrolase protein [Aspergillus carlsbadensis]
MDFRSNPKYQGFDLIQATYKKVGNHEIETTILVPHTPFSGQRPTIIRFHGGGLIMGDSLYPQFWPQWLSDLALEHGAVIVSPNYRLLPEATGLDIYDDLEDFWTWLHTPEIHNILNNHKAPTDLNLDRILLAGDSAGGLLSVNFMLSHGADIRAATAAYPCVSLDAPEFVNSRTILPFGISTPEAVITDHLASKTLDNPVSSDASPTRTTLMFAGIQHGGLGPWYARGSENSPRRGLLYPLERLEQPGVRFPKGGLTITHGRQDSVVPVEQSERFVARAREVTKGQPVGEKIALVLQDGEHGFDSELRYEEAWLKDALRTAVEAWLE